MMRRATVGGIASRLWDSPTLMTWSSLAVRLGGMVVLLPLVLHNFAVEDVAVWLLLGAIAALQVLGDVGFSQTFTRAFSNARGGATIRELGRLPNSGAPRTSTAFNTETFHGVLSMLRPVYGRLTAVSFVALAIAGTYALQAPIASSTHPSASWIAWGCVLAATTSTVWGNAYVAYLLGTERIALLRRWDTLFAFLGVVSACVVLLLGFHQVLALVMAQQIWVIASVVRNRWLCNQDADFRASREREKNLDVIKVLWPSAWRSAIGVLMSFGLIQASGLIYAKFATAVELASYLLALRIIQIISQLSQPPFYSKLPQLARIQMSGSKAEQISIAKRGMRYAHILYVLGFVSVGVGIKFMLQLIGSSAEFVSPLTWTLLGLAFFFERVGAMHLQFYSVTNHIIWHFANGVTGIIMIFAAVFFYRLMGVQGFPLAMLGAYLFFYCPYSMLHSYRAFELDRSFEFSVSGGPLAILLGYLLVVLTLTT